MTTTTSVLTHLSQPLPDSCRVIMLRGAALPGGVTCVPTAQGALALQPLQLEQLGGTVLHQHNRITQNETQDLAADNATEQLQKAAVSEAPRHTCDAAQPAFEFHAAAHQPVGMLLRPRCRRELLHAAAHAQGRLPELLQAPQAVISKLYASCWSTACAALTLP